MGTAGSAIKLAETKDCLTLLRDNAVNLTKLHACVIRFYSASNNLAVTLATVNILHELPINACIFINCNHVSCFIVF